MTQPRYVAPFVRVVLEAKEYFFFGHRGTPAAIFDLHIEDEIFSLQVYNF